jgi:hypothetical protein
MVFENCGFRIADFECTHPQTAIENQTTDSDDHKFEIRNPNSEVLLSLRELEALARALLAIFLALFDAGIARDQTRLLQHRTKVSIEFHQRAGNAMPNRARLARRATAANINQQVKLGSRLSQLQRLTDDHPQCLVREVLIERLAIDHNFTGAGA